MSYDVVDTKANIEGDPAPAARPHDSARIFRTGLCDAMAIALHRKTRLPLGLWRGYFPDDIGEAGDEAYEDCHAVVVKSFDPPIWIDVDGEHAGLPQNAVFSEKITRIVLEHATEEEVRSAFTFDDFTHEEALSRAFAYLDGMDNKIPENQA